VCLGSWAREHRGRADRAAAAAPGVESRAGYEKPEEATRGIARCPRGPMETASSCRLTLPPKGTPGCQTARTVQ